MRISDWSSDVCSSDLLLHRIQEERKRGDERLNIARRTPFDGQQRPYKARNRKSGGQQQPAGHCSGDRHCGDGACGECGRPARQHQVRPVETQAQPVGKRGGCRFVPVIGRWPDGKRCKPLRQPLALFQPAPKVEDRRVHIADLSGGAEAAVRAGPFSRWLKKGRRDSVWNAPRPESGGCSSKRNSSFRLWLSPSVPVTSATDMTRRCPFAMRLRWTITWIELAM